jgi:hypothetical protein
VSASGKENGDATHRASMVAMRRWKWAPTAVFSVMASCSGGRRRQRKGPRALEEIEGAETQLQRGWEDRVGGAHREGRVSDSSSRNPVSPTVGNGEWGSRRRGQVTKVVHGLRREEPTLEDGGRKVMALSGFFAPRQRGKIREKGSGRDVQLREREGV